jgi:hypothetical protein
VPRDAEAAAGAVLDLAAAGRVDELVLRDPEEPAARLAARGVEADELREDVREGLRADVGGELRAPRPSQEVREERLRVAPVEDAEGLGLPSGRGGEEQLPVGAPFVSPAPHTRTTRIRRAV